ncbi:EF hand family protein [Cryptosporidium serpentis]
MSTENTEIHELREVFDLLDGKTGLDVGFLRAAATCMDIPLDNSVIGRLNTLAEESGGKLDFAGFVSLINNGPEAKVFTVEDAVNVFSCLDVKKTGTIDLDDLTSCTTRLGLTKTKEELQTMLTNLDSDGDNALSPDDILTALYRYSERC